MNRPWIPPGTLPVPPAADPVVHEHVWSYSHRDNGEGPFWYCWTCCAQKALAVPNPRLEP